MSEKAAAAETDEALTAISIRWLKPAIFGQWHGAWASARQDL